MITENLGKISITPKGQWIAGIYERLDLVTDNGSSYLSLKDNNVSALDTADWMPIADVSKAVSDVEAFLLSVETAEGLRQQAELNRQTNTSTAISNAEQATDDANDAALLANEKAELANEKALLADEKAGLAATATTQANAARDGANSAAQSATNLVNSYATDLAAKELKANKQNNLTPDGTGTKFPTVDAVNAGLAVRGEKLLVDHVVTSNKVFPQVESIDYATTTITFTAPHGVTEIPNYHMHAFFAVHNDYSIKTNYKAIPTGFQSAGGYKIVEIVSPTVLRLSNVPAGTVISTANADAAFVDFSLFHFEMNTVTSTDFNIEECQAVRVRIFGKCQYGQPYIYALGNETTRDNPFDIGTLLGVGESNWDRVFSVRDGFINSLTTGYGNTFRSAGVARVGYLTFYNWRYNNITYINKIRFDNINQGCGNGTRVLIYKII